MQSLAHAARHPTFVMSEKMTKADQLSALARHIGMCIAHRIEADGTTFAGVERLARDSGRSVRVVERAVAELVEAGVIDRTRRPGLSARKTKQTRFVPTPAAGPVPTPAAERTNNNQGYNNQVETRSRPMAGCVSLDPSATDPDRLPRPIWNRRFADWKAMLPEVGDLWPGDENWTSAAKVRNAWTMLGAVNLPTHTAEQLRANVCAMIEGNVSTDPEFCGLLDVYLFVEEFDSESVCQALGFIPTPEQHEPAMAMQVANR